MLKGKSKFSIRSFGPWIQERTQLESDIEALRLVRDTMPVEEYESRMEEGLIELALKSQEIRDLESGQ